MSRIRVLSDLIKAVRNAAADLIDPSRVAARDQREGLTIVDPDSVGPSPIRTPLRPDLVPRVEAIQRALVGVYDQSLEEWLDGFERDASPESEIRWWERLVAAFECAAQRLGADAGSRKQLFQLTSSVALGATPHEIARHYGNLPANSAAVVRGCMNATK